MIKSGLETRNLRFAALLLNGLFPLLALFLLVACGQYRTLTGSNQTAPVGITLDIPKAAQTSAGTARAKAFQTSAGTVTKINITVKNADGVELPPGLTSVDDISDTGEVDVNLDVSAGLSRIFFVEALDANGKVLFRGKSDPVDLAVGVPVNISIQMLQAFLDITPSTAAVPKDQTQDFVASTREGNQEVDWSVDGVLGGDETSGTIDTEGTYTPPSVIPVDASSSPIGVPVDVTVGAVSKSDSRVTGTATVHPLTGPKLKFDPNTPASKTSGTVSTVSAGQREIAFYKGNAYTVWSVFDSESALWDVYFSESGDGTNWTQIPLETGISILPVFPSSLGPEPNIAVGPDGAIYIAYLGQAQDCSVSPCINVPAIEVLARRQGDTDFSPFAIQRLPIANVLSQPSLAVSPTGIVFVAWSQLNLLNRPNLSDILLERIKGDGTVVDTKNMTSTSTVDEQLPVVATSVDGNVFLSYEVANITTGLDAFLTVSLDGGDTFLPAVQIKPVTDGALVSRFTLAPVSGGAVHIAWEEDECGDGCLFVAYSLAKVVQDADGSLILSVAPGIYLGSAVKAIAQTAPSIASDGFGGVYIAFRENVSGTGDEIFLAKSTNTRTPFAFSQISDVPVGIAANRLDPSLAVDNAGRSFVAWTNRLISNLVIDTVLYSKGE